jgi:hypothetical protein
MSNPEIIYLEQSKSWKEGMQYRFSPDFYPITQKQYQQMLTCGTLMGNYLNDTISPNILEFRLDMIKDYRDKLWITEVQTDDRGMPAMAIARNASGISPKLPGLMELLDQSLTQKTNSPEYSLAFIYPDSESFYYAGLYDVRNILRMINPKNEILVTPRSELKIQDDTFITSPKLTGANAYFRPNYIWDFSETLDDPRLIQTKVDKNTILRPWIQSGPLETQLKEFIPEVIKADGNPRVILEQKDFILKPVAGRWSKGIAIGKYTDNYLWTRLAAYQPDLIAQKYIDPPSDWLKVADKKGQISREPFIARIEPYFVKVGDTWKLADILATCTKTQPIHGTRDCIMIPAKIE